MAKTLGDDILLIAESPESAEAIYKRDNHVLADMVAQLNKKNGAVQYHAKHPTFVRFRFDTATFELNYPHAFTQCNITSLKRFLLYMLADYHSSDYDNRQAVTTTAMWIEAFRLMKREVWRFRSKVYTDEWRDESQYRPSMRKAIRAENKKIVSALKKAKTDYERFEKLEQYFNDLKEKYQ